MEKLKQLITRILLFSIGVLAIGSSTTALGHYTGMFDADPLLDWLSVKGETLTSVGLSVSSATVIGFIARFLYLAFKENSARMLNQTMGVMQNILDRQEVIEKSQNMINDNINILNSLTVLVIEFNQVLAVKNLDSKIIDEETKEDIKAWLVETENKIKDLASQKTFSIETLAEQYDKGTNILNTVNNALNIAKGRL